MVSPNFTFRAHTVWTPKRKKEQELASLLEIDDSFKKIVIVGNDIETYTDKHGSILWAYSSFSGGNFSH